jgi:hypothetical protein
MVDAISPFSQALLDKENLAREHEAATTALRLETMKLQSLVDAHAKGAVEQVHSLSLAYLFCIWIVNHSYPAGPRGISASGGCE